MRACLHSLCHFSLNSSYCESYLKQENITLRVVVPLSEHKTTQCPLKNILPLFVFFKRRHGQYILKTPQSRMSPTEGPCPFQPLSIISLGPPEGPPPVRPAPRRNKTPKKKQPQDIPVQIFAAPPPPATSPSTAPPPPPPPPPPPLPPAFLPQRASPSSEDTPMPLREKEDPPFQAKNTLKQNLGEEETHT